MQQYDYVQDIDVSKSKPLANRKLTTTELIIAIIGSIIPLLFLPAVASLAVILLPVAGWLMGQYFKKWIGGYRRCLAPTQQVSEIIFIWVY